MISISQNRYYDIQKLLYETNGPSLRARFVTDDNGRFAFRTILPRSYPIPTDGPMGQLLKATSRHPMRPAHIHFLVNAPGFEPLVTHVFIEGDRYLKSDAVFGVKEELVCKVEQREDRVMPDGKPASGPWFSMAYDFCVKPGTGHVSQPLL
jgi:hydroxyquinol 1,2-dioxygenase